MAPYPSSRRALGGMLIIIGLSLSPAGAAPPTTPAPATLPPLGRATAGLPPARLEEAVRKARSGQDNTLRAAMGPTALGTMGRAVALVVTPDRLGSATLIDASGRFVTAWHIVRDTREVALIFMPLSEDTRVTGADAIAATVERVDLQRDLALLHVRQMPRDMRPLRLAGAQAPAPGARLRIVGHPYGEIWSMTEGRVAGQTRDYAWISEAGTAHRADVIRFSSTGATGNAGGPVVDRAGRVVALDIRRTGERTLTNVGVAASDLRRFLAKPVAARATAAAVAPASAPPPPPPCTRTRPSTTRVGAATVQALDLDCDGKPDAEWLLPDNPGAPARLSADTDGDGVPNAIYLDNDRDGTFDEVRFDTNADGTPDLAGRDLDAALQPRETRILPR